MFRVTTAPAPRQANADVDFATPEQGITALLSSVNFGCAPRRRRDPP